jgi:hypothetical protein
MTEARFEALAQAHGGDVSRWPDAVRDAAALLMARSPDFAARVLAREADLDGLMDAWRPAPASAALADAVLAAAPAPRRHAPFSRWLTRAGLGAGLAAACAAGVIVGVQTSALTQAPAGAEAVALALSGFDPGLEDDGSEISG